MFTHYSRWFMKMYPNKSKINYYEIWKNNHQDNALSGQQERCVDCMVWYDSELKG